MMVPTAEMSFPTRMLAGPGVLARLPAELSTLGVRRCLIVSDPGLEEAGLVDRVRLVLEAAGLYSEVFADVSKNPVEGDVIAGVQAFRQMNAEEEAGGLVAVGGGGPIDTAKAIALLVTHREPLAAYDDQLGGDAKIRPDLPPVVAVPTTAGTGSEVGRAGVIVVGEGAQARKVVIFSPYLLPRVALLDAELTLGLPAGLTAATGFDALTHAMEAYVARGYHPFADMYALAALARVATHLPRVVDHPANLESRHEMLLAASMGAIAFQKGLGACHALAHPLSSIAGLHHGTANAVMLPHVIRYNLDTVAERYATAGQAMGIRIAKRAEATLLRVDDLRAQLGLPDRLSDLGVTPDHVEAMTPQAVADATAAQNPRPLREEDARALYTAAL